MKKVLFMAVCLLAVFSFQRAAASESEFEVYLRGGTVNLTDGDINDGHKAQAALGVTMSSNSKQRHQGLISLEGFVMTEPAEEDGEIPRSGSGVLFEGRRNFKYGSWRFYPYLGAGLRHWSRTDSEKTINRWHEVTFLEGKIGLGVEYKFLYARGAIRRPLWIDSDQLDPAFGFEGEIGVKIFKKIRIGAFYDRFGFDNGGDFNVNFWGGKLSYTF